MKAGGTVEGYRLVTFAKAIPVEDDRGAEELADRATTGFKLATRGHECIGIVLAGSWFVITTRGKTAGGTLVEREYRVPVTNVTSSRPLPPETTEPVEAA